MAVNEGERDGSPERTERGSRGRRPNRGGVCSGRGAQSEDRCRTAAQPLLLSQDGQASRTVDPSVYAGEEIAVMENQSQATQRQSLFAARVASRQGGRVGGGEAGGGGGGGREGGGRSEREVSGAEFLSVQSWGIDDHFASLEEVEGEDHHFEHQEDAVDSSTSEMLQDTSQFFHHAQEHACQRTMTPPPLPFSSSTSLTSFDELEEAVDVEDDCTSATGLEHPPLSAPHQAWDEPQLAVDSEPACQARVTLAEVGREESNSFSDLASYSSCSDETEAWTGGSGSDIDESVSDFECLSDCEAFTNIGPEGSTPRVTHSGSTPPPPTPEEAQRQELSRPATSASTRGSAESHASDSEWDDLSTQCSLPASPSPQLSARRPSPNHVNHPKENADTPSPNQSCYPEQSAANGGGGRYHTVGTLSGSECIDDIDAWECDMDDGCSCPALAAERHGSVSLLPCTDAVISATNGHTYGLATHAPQPVAAGLTSGGAVIGREKRCANNSAGIDTAADCHVLPDVDESLTLEFTEEDLDWN